MTQNDQHGKSLSAVVSVLNQELGGDKELLKQALADFLTGERQRLDHGFEARKEYARQMGERDRLRELALKEYGLQTLKWVFLMNAGAAGLLLGYIGTRVGASQSGIAEIRGLLDSAIPFGIGCIFVAISGLSAWANFNFASQAIPSIEAMYNFFNLEKPVTEWPAPKGMPGEMDRKEFNKQISLKIDWSMRVAVGCGIFSLLSFATGVLMVSMVLT